MHTVLRALFQKYGIYSKRVKSENKISITSQKCLTYAAECIKIYIAKLKNDNFHSIRR
jgi:hypothetical protein